METYTIPQEFNQYDRIGNLTIPQVFILGFGATLIGLVIVNMNSFIWSLIFSIPIALITLIFIVFKINKIPIYEFLLIYAMYLGMPKLLIYRSDNTKEFYDIFDDNIQLLEDENPKKEYQKSKERKDTKKEKNSKQSKEKSKKNVEKVDKNKKKGAKK